MRLRGSTYRPRKEVRKTLMNCTSNRRSTAYSLTCISLLGILYIIDKFDILSTTQNNTILQTKKPKMKHLIRGLAIAFASVFALSSTATAASVDYEDDSSNLQRHKRNLIANSKKKNRISLNKRIRYNNKKKIRTIMWRTMIPSF